MNKTILALTGSIFITSVACAQEEACACKAMPHFSIAATNGKTYTDKKLTAKPTVVVFLSAGCPHNPKAMNDLNRLAGQLGSQVQFVGVTNLGLASAKTYAKTLGAKFPILADVRKSVITGFGAQHSLDIAIVCAKDKRVAKVWDGYSQATLKELVDSLPEHGGPKLKLDLSAYPVHKHSGCGF